MKRLINLNTIKKNLPSTFKLPTNFDEFVNFLSTKSPEYGFFDILWTNIDKFGLDKKALLELVPFLRLGDGGIVAFWLNTPDSINIIQIDSEGKYCVSASSFDEFIERITLHKTGIFDIDESEKTIVFKINGKSSIKLSNLNSLNVKFRKWYKKHLLLQKPITSALAEELRKKLYSIVCEMLNDGLSKVYTSDSSWWNMNFKFLNIGENIKALYLDYGNWIPIPDKYEFVEESLKLLQFTKSKNLNSFELDISSYGGVSINRDRELLIVPK